MKIDIPYDRNGKQQVEISDAANVSFLEANDVEISNENTVIENALQNPLNSSSLETFLSDARDVLIIVNDATRPTPTEKVISSIMEQLKTVDYRFIIATGVHRGPTEEELGQIFGRFLETVRDRIIVHDARKDEDMVYLGKSSNGTPMYVNKEGADAHKIIIISSVEPHYFAGYTGGRKSFLPGIAGFETVERNHKLALNPAAKALALEGNPVHEDMVDAIKTVNKEIFSIMTVLDKHHNVYAASAGHIEDSFIHAVHKANEVFAAPLAQKADIVVSVVKFPQDIDLYQAQKGTENAKLALRENGIMILVAKCRDGIGGKTFADLLSSCETATETLEKIDRGYVLGYHKAGKLAEISTWAEMWAVTDVEPEKISSLFMKPFTSLQSAIDEAVKVKGENADILFLMDGGLTVPLVNEK
ncbi:MAG: nickel-dependent lactate racemase [Thermodesulfobacteriota bacterium]